MGTRQGGRWAIPGKVRDGGCKQDEPDSRDYSTREETVAFSLGVNAKYGRDPGKLPSASGSDIEAACTPIEDQGPELLSCSAHAAVGLLEYFIKWEFGETLDLSRLFLFQQALMWGQQPLKNRGVSLRIALKAVQKAGVPPEAEYLKYLPGNLDKKPKDEDLELALKYRCGNYFRLDDSETLKRDGFKAVLGELKLILHAGYPCVFGFELYESTPKREAKRNPMIPIPVKGEDSKESHSVVAVGYNDALKIVNPETRKTTTGAIRIRNSWGKDWGDGGYGWLPYDYVTEGRTFDFWSITKAMFDRSLLRRN